MVFDGTSFFVTVGVDASFDGPLTRVPAQGGTPVVVGQADGAVVAGGCLYAIDFLDGVYSVASE
jgi:hypothetical protein